MIAPQVWHGGASCWFRNEWRGAASTGSATGTGVGSAFTSVASLLLTTEAMVAERPKKKSRPSPGGGAPDYGGEDMEY